MANQTRLEHDTMGEIAVPIDALWGAQTQRALQHFHISQENMPPELILALAQVKRACALCNGELGLLDPALAQAIAKAADEVLAGQHQQAFPLSVWQTGSGTQSNMNMNEVLAHRATLILREQNPDAAALHPNDAVNLGQSSNDVFPSAMHVATALRIRQSVLPSLVQLIAALSSKQQEFVDLIKIGRTHLQDATPLTLGQEISAWVAQLHHAQKMIEASLPALYELAIGGTAVGTGLNTHAQFGARVSAELARQTGLPFVSASNKFAALAGHDALVSAHAALKTLATALIKIANDIRWLASGPRCGLGELQLPENEPGSSIMPGKINPTQCEAMIMLCYQVCGNDVAISMGAAAGQFELNVCKPLIAHNVLQSVRLLADGMNSLTRYCIAGLQANRERISQHLAQSLMLVTALSPHLGYDQAAAIAKHAHQQGVSLKEAALALKLLSAEQFDLWVRAENMLGNNKQERV